MIDEIQLVVFNLANEEYGVNIHETKEIIKIPDITKIPNAPKIVSGIINLRGKIIAIINLREKFNMGSVEGNYVIIAENDGSSFGFMVDNVKEIIKVLNKDIKKAPSIVSEKIHADYMKGVAILGERMIILLDFQKLLSEEEISSIRSIKNVEQPKEVISQKIIDEKSK